MIKTMNWFWFNPPFGFISSIHLFISPHATNHQQPHPCIRTDADDTGPLIEPVNLLSDAGDGGFSHDSLCALQRSRGKPLTALRGFARSPRAGINATLFTVALAKLQARMYINIWNRIRYSLYTYDNRRIHSFNLSGVIIFRDLFVLGCKSTLKVVGSTLKR